VDVLIEDTWCGRKVSKWRKFHSGR